MKSVIALILIIAVANGMLETLMLKKKLIDQAREKRFTPTENVTGGWQKVNPKLFSVENGGILNEANIAVAQKYDPASQGYEFEQVVSVEEQIVSGVNYNVVLEYSNGEGSYQMYDVVLYVVPWNPSDNQIVKCDLVNTISA